MNKNKPIVILNHLIPSIYWLSVYVLPVLDFCHGLDYIYHGLTFREVDFLFHVNARQSLNGLFVVRLVWLSIGCPPIDYLLDSVRLVDVDVFMQDDESGSISVLDTLELTKFGVGLLLGKSFPSLTMDDVKGVVISQSSWQFHLLLL